MIQINKLDRFTQYAIGVLGYNIFVILWGAFVRATGSGAGCGAHWPTCNGEIIPRGREVETLIEFTHRATSGLALILVAGLLVWAFRAYPKGHLVRRGTVLSSFFILLEAALGAGLVLFGLVEDNASLTRAIVIALHLVNTYLLLGVLTLTVWWAMGGSSLDLNRRRTFGVAILAGLVGTALIGATGAIVALGDTLFPPASLAAGLAQDVDPTAHFLVRLRLVHPLLAILIGAGLLALATTSQRQVTTPLVSKTANMVKLLVLVQWVAGVINVILLAPVWMQLVHLLLADGLWIALVWLAASVLAQRSPAPVISSDTDAATLRVSRKTI